ncbi:MAG: hypothetical protein LQ345_006536 [Seirophora villosa]|nr:MAG: hypothetical protein LQ345_006536 [Seirophora villosa]
MGSPLSAPFSLFPTPSPPPSSEAPYSKTLHSCTYPPCRYRTPLPADLDRHLAIHHSSIGHSPISALNTIALSPVTFSEEEDDNDARPTPMRNYSYPSPPSPPCASAAATTMQHTPDRSYHAQPDTVPTWSSSTSSSSSSSRSSSSVGGRGGGGGGGFFFAKLRGGQSGNKQQQVQQRRRGTVMRCGRHGDEWLGLTGWRFWR